ncbi:SsgA family sporulation/cell division regulator [Streptomyces sp. NRRL B-24484]|uniref:SsgA family sporulation/cell division regulator n=1 Tax=Streptomyces sp. NRRL B-24484 TaxID=1463833 RepID=UPI000694CDA2|nr:SsgA family sporulation/cell division regulator [Streptomyces sp. NRRL B-24484]
MVPPQRASTVGCASFVLLHAVVGPDFDVPIPSCLRYHIKDPYAVHLDAFVDMTEPITWSFARDLLIRGVDEHASQGDVSIWPGSDDGDPGSVFIFLNTENAAALLRAEHAEVRAFLDWTACVALPGTEAEHYDLEKFVRNLPPQPPSAPGTAADDL